VRLFDALGIISSEEVRADLPAWVLEAEKYLTSRLPPAEQAALETAKPKKGVCVDAGTERKTDY
jgi:hypothetical protein